MSDLSKRSRPKGMELFEIKPAIFGGDPSIPGTKTWLTRQQYFESVRTAIELLAVCVTNGSKYRGRNA
ncbi:hypothetical protein PSCICG_11110 [Pseudomonas cichorii]|nr:hypothetical protein PSCICG_11110 [Pseudomonas cichorii]